MIVPETQAGASATIPEDPPSYDRGALETSIADKMASVFADGNDKLGDPVTPAASANTEPEPVAEEKTTETEPEVETEPATSEQAKPTLAAVPAKEMIPAAYVRSLKAYQWTDKDIADAYKASPDGFFKTAERIHLSRVQETQRWADMGRQSKAATPAVDTKTPAAPKFDAKALRDKYGDEPFIAAMEAQAAQLEQATAFITQSRQAQETTNRDNLGKQIDGFFGSKDLSPYHDHYGKHGASLTDQQVATRTKVLEMADALISGARVSGRNLTLEEALTTAHDAVSSPIREQAAITKIKQQVSTRQAAISQRPASRSPNALNGDDRKALESNVKSRLSKVFK